MKSYQFNHNLMLTADKWWDVPGKSRNDRMCDLNAFNALPIISSLIVFEGYIAVKYGRVNTIARCRS
jgi:hypothetical protein